MRLRISRNLLPTFLTLLALASTAIGADVRWIGAAQDVAQVDTITFAGDWSATGETFSITCNNKTIELTTGATMDTTDEVAAGVAEAINSTDTSLSADATVNSGGYQYGEFRDVVATVSASVVTLTSTTPGTPYTVSVSETSAGTAAHADDVVAATGKNWVDNGDNYVGGSEPSGGDVIVADSGSVDMLYGYANLAEDVGLRRSKNYYGNIGLLKVNTTHSGFSYPEYRGRYLICEPVATTGSVTVDIDGDSQGGRTYVDFGSNDGASIAITATVYGSRAATTDGAAVQFVGGVGVLLVTYGGNVDVGTQTDENATTILRSRQLPGSGNDPVVRIGTKASYQDTSDGIATYAGTLTLEADCDNSSNVVAVHGGTLIAMPTCAVNDLYCYGGRTDWRGTQVDTLYVYDAEFDAKRAQAVGITNDIELYDGFIFRDPFGVVLQPMKFNGCTPSDGTLELRQNVSLDPTAL